MAYIIFIIISLILIGCLFFNKYHQKNDLPMEKTIAILGVIVFIFRMFCYKSTIANNSSSYLGLDKSPLNNQPLTLFCLIFIWLGYSSTLFVLLKPFFKIKILDNIVKYICPFIFLLELIFNKQICIILEGEYGFFLPTFLAIESALGFSLSLYYLITTFKESNTKKDILKMFITFILLSMFCMPNYFLQYVFGQPLLTLSWSIKNFTPYHRFVFYGNIVFPFLIYFLLRKKSEEFKRFSLIMICLGALVSFLVNYNYTIFQRPWDLPFHLCNTAMFILPLVLIFKMKKLFYFTYFINVVGALIAMLIPNYDDNLNIFSLRMLSFWSNHYIAFYMPILFVALKQFPRPKLKEFFYSMLAFFGYYVLVLVLNVVFTANGHSVDYFFINSDFVADKLGTWAEKIFELSFTFTIKNHEYTFHPLYQLLYFIVYILIGLAVWFVYEQFYKLSDGNSLVFKRLKKIRLDEYALKSALKGRKMSEPMEKDAKIKYELIHFSKRYATNKNYAVHDANLLVNAGEIFGFLGPNGAGKSTIIKSTVGIQSITEGKINICGYDVALQPVEAKSLIGYVPDHYALYEKLTGREYINYIADIYDVSKEDRDERISKYVKLFELEAVIDSMIKTYSHGMKQKITIISALVHNPKIWILDEPLTGLDPNSIYQVKECMKEHASKGNIVFFSSHLIDIVEKLCQRIAIIRHGQILCVKDVDEIEKNGESLEQFYLKTINEEESE